MSAVNGRPTVDARRTRRPGAVGDPRARRGAAGRPTGRLSQMSWLAWLRTLVCMAAGLCGPLLRPYARELVGVDLSPRMLDKARAQLDKKHLQPGTRGSIQRLLGWSSGVNHMGWVEVDGQMADPITLLT